MKDEIRYLVAERAGHRCEYCHVPQIERFYTYHIEHVIARQHGGGDGPTNLCYSCPECNQAKGTNVAGIWRGRLVPLFNPRRQDWARHFRWRGARLVGITLAGKVTVRLLNINHPMRVRFRQFLIMEGRFPPRDYPTI